MPDDWNHGCTRSYDKNGDLVWDMPRKAKEGDLLLLLLSRTDHYLPWVRIWPIITMKLISSLAKSLEIDGWKYGASCFKNGNDQKECFTRRDCKKMKDEYCQWFPRGKGRDLATVIFFKTLKKGSTIRKSFKYKIGGFNPGWGFLLAVKGVDRSDPIRRTGITSSDNSVKSIFPSVHGKKGDLLLLSMAFDDKSSKSDFLPPAGKWYKLYIDGAENITQNCIHCAGTDLVDFISGSDETGFLFSKQLSSDGKTGELKTKGKGGSQNKDALITLVLKHEDDVKKQNKNLRTRLWCESNVESEMYDRNCILCPYSWFVCTLSLCDWFDKIDLTLSFYTHLEGTEFNASTRVDNHCVLNQQD